MAPLTPKEFLVAMMMGVIWGLACMYLAKQKGRDPRAWFLLGLFFSIFALAILFLVPSQKKMQAVALAKAEAALKDKEILEKTSFTPLKTTLSLRKWYYLDANHDQHGPVNFDELKEQKLKGNISNSTYLWSEGMLEWQILDNLSYLKTELN